MDYSPGICFQKSLVNMYKAKALTKNNQLGKRIRSKNDGASVAPSSTYELPQMIALWVFLVKRPKNCPWGWGYLYPRQRMQNNMQEKSKR